MITRASVERLALRYARFALAAAFLSAVAGRLGLWGSNDFESFVRYTAKVNSFMPSFTIRFLAISATVLETLLGFGLLIGVRLRWIAAGAAALLMLFGTAMALSFGIKEPLDYSVFSASACALLVSVRASGSPRRREVLEKTTRSRGVVSCDRGN